MSYECNKKKLVVKSRTFFSSFDSLAEVLMERKQTKPKIKKENNKKIFSWMGKKNINNYNALIL